MPVKSPTHPPTFAESPVQTTTFLSRYGERMASALWVALLVELLVLVIPGSSVAPGDEGPLCEQLRGSGAAPIPVYSANTKVLMDSWNYINLLPPRIGAVWDQVDNDENNPSVITTNVSWLRNSECDVNYYDDVLILQ